MQILMEYVDSGIPKMLKLNPCVVFNVFQTISSKSAFPEFQILKLESGVDKDVKIANFPIQNGFRNS